MEEGRCAQSQGSPGTVAQPGGFYRRFWNAGLREKEGKREKNGILGNIQVFKG